MPLVYPTGYYDRTDPTKYYDKHLFRANYVLQGAELNEIQSEAFARIRGMGDALFKDGAVIKNAQIVIDPATGETQCEAGIIYLAGKLYGVPAATITLPITGTLQVGVYLVSSIIDETADTGLRDPAITAGNYLEPGAHRLKVLPQWGASADTPPADSAFFSVYTVVDALVQPHAPPPDLSPVALAISRYDVQSTGSNYVSRGLDVKRLDDVNNQQQYLLTEGLARIGGLEMESRHAIRSFYAATPDLETTNAESHAATSDPQTVTLNHTPVAEVQLVLITKTVTSENVSRSQTPGGQDSLAHDSIVAVSLVQQGGTTYNVTSDYVLTGDQIDWAPGGAEPAGGSTYQVTYTYTAVYPEEAGILGAVTDTTAVINGATNGTTILIGYTWKMPRYDRLCINAFGDVVYVTGVSHPSQPVPPPIPKTLLPLATLYQTWNAATRTCTPDAVRMVSMAELSVLERRIDDLYALVGDHRALAMNRQQDRAGTNRMPNQIPNRMTIVEITYDSDSHIEHEVARDDTDMLTVRYLRMKGNAAYEYDANKMVNPTMRQWSWVSRALFRNPDLHMATIAGRIGKGFATELLAFRDLAPMLPSREEVILNPKQAKVPEDPSAQFLITDMLADAAGVGNIDKLLDYCKRLPKEMQAKFCKAAAMRHSEILATAAFGKWAVEFQSVLR